VKSGYLILNLYIYFASNLSFKTINSYARIITSGNMARPLRAQINVRAAGANLCRLPAALKGCVNSHGEQSQHIRSKQAMITLQGMASVRVLFRGGAGWLAGFVNSVPLAGVLFSVTILIIFNSGNFVNYTSAKECNVLGHSIWYTLVISISDN
jgi:hypothetical protein